MSSEKVPDLMAALEASLKRAKAARVAREKERKACEDCGGTGESDEGPADDGDTECQTCDGSGLA